jgi:hypothetical protein
LIQFVQNNATQAENLQLEQRLMTTFADKDPTAPDLLSQPSINRFNSPIIPSVVFHAVPPDHAGARAK